MLIMDKTEHGVTFTVDKDQDLSSIVVEVTTNNHPLFFGAGDIRETDARTDLITLTENGILIHKANGDELAAPVTTLSDKKEAKIYQFGNDSHYYMWSKELDGTFLREYFIKDCGEEKPSKLLGDLYRFRDRTHIELIYGGTEAVQMATMHTKLN